MSAPRLAIVSCVRNEEELLPAFLAYHHALGVRRAYVFLDRCTDGTAHLLRGWPWVEVHSARRQPSETMERFQHRCVCEALAFARADGVEWLLHLDPDEFAWGGSLDDPISATTTGNLLAMLDRARPDTEMVHLRPLEIVPRVRPPGSPFWALQDVMVDGVIERDVFDPATGTMQQLRRVLGHTMGKCAVRVAADVEPYSSHRFTRRQGVFPPEAIDIPTESLGYHLHYVVRDGASWRAKFARFAGEPDVWSRGNPQEFPKRSWKRIAGRMTLEEAEQYFREWIAVPDAVIDEHRQRDIVRRAPFVGQVLRESGFIDEHGRATPRPRRRCRVAFVAIDSADADFIRSWAAAGDLPTFARLLATSRTIPTDGLPGTFVGAIWPTIVTATRPGRHGYHSWAQVNPGTFEERLWRKGKSIVDPAPFWLALSRAGRRVCLLDVPLAGMTPGFEGTQILEWGCHDAEDGYRTQPPDVASAIIEAVGPHPVPPNCNGWRDAASLVAFHLAILRGVAKRTRLHRFLLNRDDWDLFASVYGDSHCVGHQSWQQVEAIRDVYRAIDASLADLLEALGPDTTVVWLLTHGLKPHDDPTHLLDEMLARLDAAWDTRGPLRRNARITRRATHLLAGPRNARRMMAVENNKAEGAIRMNVIGREPDGRIPANALDATIDRLEADLSTFTNTATGHAIVARVLRTSDVYPGPRAGALPDLFVQFITDGPVRQVHSPIAGTITRDYDGCRTGDHRPEGLLGIVGPGIIPQTVTEPIGVEHIAPTLAALLGVQLDDVDGRPLIAPAA